MIASIHKKLGYLILFISFYLTGSLPAQDSLHAQIDLRNFSIEDIFQNVQIHSVSIDNRGLVYFAFSGGIFEFDGNEWRSIAIPGNNVMNVLAKDPKGRIYGGGNKAAGFLFVDNAGNTRFQSLLNDSTPAFNDTIIDVHPIGEQVYFVGLNSISTFVNGEFKHVAEGKFTTSEVLGSTLIISSEDEGLQYLNEYNELITLAGTRGFRAKKIKALDDSHLLIATRSSGFYKLDFGSDKLKIERWPLTVADPFIDISVSSIDIIQNRIIAIGTFQDGLFLTDLNGALISRYSSKEGLFNNTVFDVFFTPQSTLWAGLNEGVSLITIPTELSGLTPVRSAKQIEDIEDSIQTKPSFLDKVRNLYHTSIGSWFSGELKTDTLTNPSISSAEFVSIIRKVELIANDSLIFGGAYSESKNGVQALDQADTANIEFSYEHNAFRFTYSTNNFENIDNLEYQVKLEGLDRGWSTWSQNIYREYTNLDWGEYQFKVHARDANNNISRIATYSFSIKPPWYESTWFYLLQFLVIMLALTISGILNKTGKFLSLSEALIAVVVIVIFQYVDLYAEPYLDEYSNDIAIFQIVISIIFGFSLEFIEELFHKTIAALTGLSKVEKEKLKLAELSAKEHHEQPEPINN